MCFFLCFWKSCAEKVCFRCFLFFFCWAPKIYFAVQSLTRNRSTACSPLCFTVIVVVVISPLHALAHPSHLSDANQFTFIQLNVRFEMFQTLCVNIRDAHQAERVHREIEKLARFILRGRRKHAIRHCSFTASALLRIAYFGFSIQMLTFTHNCQRALYRRNSSKRSYQISLHILRTHQTYRNKSKGIFCKFQSIISHTSLNTHKHPHTYTRARTIKTLFPSIFHLVYASSLCFRHA